MWCAEGAMHVWVHFEGKEESLQTGIDGFAP